MPLNDNLPERLQGVEALLGLLQECELAIKKLGKDFNVSLLQDLKTILTFYGQDHESILKNERALIDVLNSGMPSINLNLNALELGYLIGNLSNTYNENKSLPLHKNLLMKLIVQANKLRENNE